MIGGATERVQHTVDGGSGVGGRATKQRQIDALETGDAGADTFGRKHC